MFHVQFPAAPLWAFGFIFLLGCTQIVSPDGSAGPGALPGAAPTQTGSPGPSTGGAPPTSPPSDGTAQPSDSQGEIIETNGTRHLASYNLDDFYLGCFGLDCIPSIDSPLYQTVSEADTFLGDNDRILSVSFNGETKAYPTRILDRHEIVNDFFNGEPILISYCPLCGTGLAFERSINGEAVEFGVSGKLYNSDLVMYDRKTKSYWPQVKGVAAVGELAGTKLTQIPMDVMLWKDWKEAYPQGSVLKPVLPSFAYADYPYGDYETSGSVFFPTTNQDTRYHSKAWTHGIEEGSAAKVWPEEEVEAAGPVINDTFNNTPLLVLTDPESGVIRFFNRTFQEQTLTFALDNGTLKDEETGTQWDFQGRAISGEHSGTVLSQVPAVRGFWFAWVAFHPDTEVFTA